MATSSLYEQLIELQGRGTAVVLVILADALGSTPQEAGAKMLVTAAGLHTGTIGGGKVEAKAMELARELLASGTTTPRFVNWALKTDVGMTCGGSVKLYFEPYLAGGAGAAWPIWIFGAGHVVQALVPVLAPLDCQLTIVDPRRDWLDRLPRAGNVHYIEHENPAELVPAMPANAFLLCLTKGHASDRPVLQRALAERDFPFVGVIGSEAKAEVLRRELVAAGLPAEQRPTVSLPGRPAFRQQRPARNRPEHRGAAADGEGSEETVGRVSDPLSNVPKGRSKTCPTSALAPQSPRRSPRAVAGDAQRAPRPRSRRTPRPRRGSPRAREIASISGGSPTALLPWIDARLRRVRQERRRRSRAGASLKAGIW